MTTKPRSMLRRLTGILAGVLIALAMGLAPAGCADINIDASNFQIPGLSASAAGASESAIETSGELSCGVELTR